MELHEEGAVVQFPDDRLLESTFRSFAPSWRPAATIFFKLRGSTEISSADGRRAAKGNGKLEGERADSAMTSHRCSSSAQASRRRSAAADPFYRDERRVLPPP